MRHQLPRLLASAWLLSASSVAAAATPGSVHHTYPQPPRAKPADPMRVSPGLQIPEHPEHYTWRISGKLGGGKLIHQAAVPLYRLPYLERPRRSGEIAVGTTVKLDHVTHVGKVIYYQVPAPEADPAKEVLNPEDMTWVSGMFIEPVSYNPPQG